MRFLDDLIEKDPRALLISRYSVRIMARMGPSRFVMHTGEEAGRLFDSQDKLYLPYAAF